MIKTVWILTLLVSNPYESAEQIIGLYKDKEQCQAELFFYESMPTDRNKKWTSVKYKCKVMGGSET